ncbi:MAG: hypothetical protein RLZZ210_1126 [Pseudomonadota bacterium]|jgi:PIN domain nuclease of toxin-antitoxin system
MRVLIDTHIYLWAVTDDDKLSQKARQIIMKANEVFVSSASIWEISIKQSLGKIDGDIELLIQGIEQSGFVELPIRAVHAFTVSHLPNIHKDPFDRMLIAQAISEPMHFLTADEMLQDYSELVIKL